MIEEGEECVYWEYWVDVVPNLEMKLAFSHSPIHWHKKPQNGEGMRNVGVFLFPISPPPQIRVPFGQNQLNGRRQICMENELEKIKMNLGWGVKQPKMVTTTDHSKTKLEGRVVHIKRSSNFNFPKMFLHI